MDAGLYGQTDRQTDRLTTKKKRKGLSSWYAINKSLNAKQSKEKPRLMENTIKQQSTEGELNGNKK